MSIHTDAITPYLLQEELSRAQQSVRLGEAQREHDRVNKAYLMGLQLRLVLGRVI